MHILHGEDLALSRQTLTTLISTTKLKNHEVITFTPENISLTLLKQALESNSLFDQPRTVVVENFSSLGDDIKDYLFAHPTANLVIWEGKKLTPAQTKKFPQAKVEEFKLPQLLFTFLDALGVKPGAQLLPLLNQLLVQQEPDMVFALYHRRWRHMLLYKLHAKEALAADKVAGWQLGKLAGQCKNLPTEKIFQVYEACFQFDLNRKRSRTSFTTQQFLQQQIGQC